MRPSSAWLLMISWMRGTSWMVAARIMLVGSVLLIVANDTQVARRLCDDLTGSVLWFVRELDRHPGEDLPWRIPRAPIARDRHPPNKRAIPPILVGNPA